MKLNKLELLFIKYTPLVLLTLWGMLFLNHLIRGLVVTPLIPILLVTVFTCCNWYAKNGMYFENYTGTSRDPYIDYEVAVSIAHNGTFFGSNF